MNMLKLKFHALFSLGAILSSGYTLTAQCLESGNHWNETWVSCTKSPSPNPVIDASYWLLFEFQEARQFIDCQVWNANRAGESGQGIKDVRIDYSENGNNWINLGTFTFPQAPETEDYQGFTGPSLPNQAIKFILFTVLSTHQTGNCAALSEVKFNIDPSACYGELDLCGVCNGPGESLWFQDVDGDGLGNHAVSVLSCEPPVNFVGNADDPCDNAALGWSDVLVLFNENGCNNCHNSDAQGGLDLRFYEEAVAGGNKCGPALFEGNNFVQSIVSAGYSGCDTPLNPPSMNDRASGELDDAELAKLQAWIDGGAPEYCQDYIHPVDNDQDGYAPELDCDDNNAEINPGALEVLGNEIDENCDGEIASGIEHTFDKQSIKIYPNPTTDILFLQFDHGLRFSARLYNINGQCIIKAKQPTQISLQHLSAGAYILEVIEEVSQRSVSQLVILTK